jgi:hypothetical protein
MWIRALRAIPNVGGTGTVRNIDERSANCLLVLGWAERAEDPAAQKPKRTYVRRTETPVDEPKPKRVYRRKDIVPAPDFVAEDPQPMSEPEPVAEDDDATVRLGD